MSLSFSLAYGTNIWSHHQAPIATELARIIRPDRFRMALFEEVHDERRALGWSEKPEHPWVIGPPKSDAQRYVLYQQCIEADVMIWGACPHEILEARTAAGKLTLVASERLLKKPFHHLRLLNPRYAAGFRRFRAMVNHPCVHALTMGHYAADDVRTIGAFGDQIWKWGYFAEVNPERPRPLPDQPLKILWVGRMLDWKRVDTLLRALGRIHHVRSFGQCAIVGDGPKRKSLKRLARRLNLDPVRVQFLPSVPFAEVRRLMRDFDICVLSSNRHEGWGVVANEAMSEGCVLVANEQAGAAQELIVDNETGFLFRDGDDRHLANLLQRLGGDHSLRMRVRQQAWKLMQDLWHPRVAAERLVSLCKGLLGGELPDFSEGPCSLVRRQEIPGPRREIAYRFRTVRQTTVHEIGR